MQRSGSSSSGDRRGDDAGGVDARREGLRGGDALRNQRGRDVSRRPRAHHAHRNHGWDGLGAERGILFKSAIALETAAPIDVVVMGKTGTLTKGEPEVTDFVVEGMAEDEVLRLIAAVETESEHPLAQAVVSFAAEKLDGRNKPRAEAFENVPGQGAVATVDGRLVAVGNVRLMDRESVKLGQLGQRREELASSGRTVVCVAIDGVASAIIGIADAPRETSVAAVAALKDTGIEVVMLTGDNQATAERIAHELGVQTVIAEVLPGDKADQVDALQEGGRRVAMVGDGVNDAPALARADLGIAIGAGTDVAIETADVLLMRSDPLDVPTALDIGRGTVRKMRQNLCWAIGYNSVALPIAAGVFEPAFGLVLRPEIAAISCPGQACSSRSTHFCSIVSACRSDRWRTEGAPAEVLRLLLDPRSGRAPARGVARRAPRTPPRGPLHPG